MRSFLLRTGLASGLLLLAVLISSPDLAEAQGKGQGQGQGQGQAKRQGQGKGQGQAKRQGQGKGQGQAKRQGQGKGQGVVGKGQVVLPGSKEGKELKRFEKGGQPAARAPGAKGPQGKVRGTSPARAGRALRQPGATAPGRKMLKDRPRNAKAKAVKQARFAKEQRKHLKNMARIQRIEALGKEHKRAALSEKASTLRAKEQRRHRKAMGKLRGTTSPRPRSGTAGKALPGKMPHMKPGKPLRLKPGKPVAPIKKPAPARPAAPTRPPQN
jgi:hypothetical protein